MSSLFRHRAMNPETARRLLLAHCAEMAAIRAAQKTRRGESPAEYGLQLSPEGRWQWVEIKRGMCV